MGTDTPRRPRRKILMLIPQLGYGGAETSFVRVSNLLARYHDLTIVLFTRHYGIGGYSDTGLEPDNTIILLDESEGSSSRLSRWIRRWRKFRVLKRENDVAISFLSGPNTLNALVGYPGKTVISVRGSRNYDPVISPWMRYLYQYLIDPFVYCVSDRIVGISAGLSNEIPWFARQRSCHKFRVIELFVDAKETITRSAEPIEDKILILKGQPIIVAIGRLSVEKGFQPLVEIFAELSRHINAAKLFIIGDGPLHKALETQCASLELPVNCLEVGTASVILTGYRENPLRYLKIASVFVLSSLTEGFSNSLVEALASGKLVMAVNGPWGARSVLYNSPPDTVSPYPTEMPEVADYGLLMPRIDLPRYKQVWLDELHTVLSNPTAYANLAKRGPDRVRQFSYFGQPRVIP